jgi:hypothetical protein
MRPADMIDMGVGNHDHFHLEEMAVEDLDNRGNIVAGIDHNCLPCDFIPDHGTIARQQPYWQDFVDHCIQLTQ